MILRKRVVLWMPRALAVSVRFQLCWRRALIRKEASICLKESRLAAPLPAANCCAHGLGQMLAFDPAGTAEDEGPLDQVLQLAHVAGVVVRHQAGQAPHR